MGLYSGRVTPPVPADDDKPNKKDKAWKDIFLKSGLPLEHSVAGVLKRLGLKVQVEYNYVRRNERNEDVTFSVDLRAVHRDHRDLLLSALVECKYCSPGTQWIMVPNEDEAPFNQHRPSYFHGIDLFATESLFTLNTYDLYPQELMVHRGVQIARWGNVSPGTVSEAVAQLRYAALEQNIEWSAQRIRDAEMAGPDAPRLPYASVCLIVTTAEIRVLKPMLSLEAFQKAESADDVTVPQPYVFLHARPDGIFERQAVRRIHDVLSDEALTAVHGPEVLAQVRASSAVTDLKDYTLGASRLRPDVFIVVQYDALESVMAKILVDAERLSMLNKHLTWDISKRK